MKTNLEINISGKKYPAKVGFTFLETVTKTEGITLTQLFEKLEAEAFFFVPKLIEYAIKNAGGEITISEIHEWLDEAGFTNDEVQNFSTVLGDSIKIHIPKDFQPGNVGKQTKPKK